MIDPSSLEVYHSPFKQPRYHTAHRPVLLSSGREGYPLYSLEAMTSTPAVLGGLLLLACNATGGALLGVCKCEVYQVQANCAGKVWYNATRVAQTLLYRASLYSLHCFESIFAVHDSHCCCGRRISPSLRSVFLSTKSVSSFVSRRQMILSWVRGAHQKSGNRRAGALTCIVGKREMCAPRLACVTYARRWQSLALFSCGDWKVVYGLLVCPLHLCTVETVTNQHILRVYVP